MWEAPQVPKPKIRGCFVAVRRLRCLHIPEGLCALFLKLLPIVVSATRTRTDDFVARAENLGINRARSLRGRKFTPVE